MILNLKEAGQEAVLDVKTAAVVQGNYGEQVKFETTDGDVLFAPVASVTRQLDRIGVAEIEHISGKKIHVSRTANHKTPGAKPYWDFSKATAADIAKTEAPADEDSYDSGYLPGDEQYEAPAKTNGAKPVVADALTKNGDGAFATLATKYKECFAAAIKMTDSLTSAGIDADGSAVAAMAATLFIARNQKGV